MLIGACSNATMEVARKQSGRTLGPSSDPLQCHHSREVPGMLQLDASQYDFVWHVLECTMLVLRDSPQPNEIAFRAPDGREFERIQAPPGSYHATLQETKHKRVSCGTHLSQEFKVLSFLVKKHYLYIYIYKTAQKGPKGQKVQHNPPPLLPPSPFFSGEPVDGDTEIGFCCVPLIGQLVGLALVSVACFSRATSLRLKAHKNKK